MLQLFITFLKIGAFTLGGGFAMISLIENEIVTKHHWIEKSDFLDIIALAQSMPGLFAANIASVIGKRLFGLRGAFVAVIGVTLPSIIVILLIAMCFRTFQDNVYVEKFFKALRPCVVALIIASCTSLFKVRRDTKRNKFISLATILLTVGLIVFLNVSPIWIILIALIIDYALPKIISRFQ